MVICPNCGNSFQFIIIADIHKVLIRTYDEDGDLLEETPDKEGLNRLETWICTGCGSLIPTNKTPEQSGKTEIKHPANNYKKPSLKEKDKKKPSNKDAKPDRVGERPTEKQLKYLDDLADLLEISTEDREGFKNLTKKEVSDKLTEYYKQCKKQGLEI